MRVSLEKRLCCPCHGVGFAVAACTSPCTPRAYTRSGIPTTYVLFHLTLFYPSYLCTNSQINARLKTAAKNAAARGVLVSREKRLCYPCTGAGFAVAACAHCCMEKDEVEI